MIERTFAYLKPDTIDDEHIGRVLTRIEEEGFIIEHMARYWFTEADVDALYAEHVGKPFYETLRAFTRSRPIALLVLAREDAVAHWRRVLGPTDPATARINATGSLRAIYGNQDGIIYRNVAHGSATLEDATRELALARAWFGASDLKNETSEALDAELARGRSKFPGTRFLLAALAEECGELAEALTVPDWEREARIRVEALQVAAVALRIYEEGDATRYNLPGFISLLINVGDVARAFLQRRSATTPLLCVGSATKQLLAHGDTTFINMTDEEAQK